jgi:hypothetical protein
LSVIDPRLQATASVPLITAPWWVDVLQNVSLVGSTIAAVCGAIVGLHAVVRLWRKR